MACPWHNSTTKSHDHIVYLNSHPSGRFHREMPHEVWVVNATAGSPRPHHKPHPTTVAVGARGVALSQDFRKFAKKSKAGADPEFFSKMAGDQEKESGIFAIWGGFGDFWAHIFY